MNDASRLIEDAPSVQKPVAPFKRNLDKTLSAISKRPAKMAGAGTTASGAVCQAAPAAGDSLTLPCPQLRPITRYFVSINNDFGRHFYGPAFELCNIM